jgi:hypothetical protein
MSCARRKLLTRISAASWPNAPNWPILGARSEPNVAKGIEKAKKDNKPKLSTKEKQKKKKEKKASKVS